MARAKKEKKHPVVELEENDDWEIESNLRTLLEAEKIRSNPEKMKKISALAKKQAQDLKGLAGLRAIASEKINSSEDE